MAKKIKSFLTYSFIIIIILIIVILVILFYNYYSYQNNVYEGVDNNYFTIKLDDLSKKENSDPSPIGIYRVSCLNSAAVSDFSANLLSTFTENPVTVSSEVITIIPNSTMPTKPHFANIFPSSYKITVLFSSTLFDLSGTHNYVDTSQNSVYALNIKMHGPILDTSYNVIGYASKDKYNPYKFTISVYDNGNINKINLFFAA